MGEHVLNIARSYLGTQQWSAGHKALIDEYNAVFPRPVGYRVSYDDDWCDAFVTVVADRAGASHLIGRECGVQRHIHIFNDLGIWLGRVWPQAGDIVTFDWDGGGFADHIGFVERVDGETITTIEGNAGYCVARSRYAWNAACIKGYARPRYEEATEMAAEEIDRLAREVLDRRWGNGAERIRRLEQAGYDAKAVQNRVNELVAEREDTGREPDYPEYVTVADWATHWQTGQPIADWVRGRQFRVIQSREVSQSASRRAFLLERQGTPIGWLLDQDVA